jgi:hypothetical protein
MTSIECRQRLKPEAQFNPVDELEHRPIRASDWEFRINWESGEPPRRLFIDDALIHEWATGDGPRKTFQFSLPATVQNLTRIRIDHSSEDPDIAVIDVLPGYQLPEAYLRVLYEHLNDFDDIDRPEFFIGDHLTEDLGESEDTILDRKTSGNIQKEDLPPEICQEIIELLEKAIKNPKTRLIDDKYLIPPGEAQRITTDTIEYFTRHPETWRTHGHIKPKPLLLLDDRSTEDLDVYENRFVSYFLQNIDRRLQGLLQRYQETLDGLKHQLPETQLRMNRGMETFSSEKVERIEQETIQAQDHYNRLYHFREKVREFQANPIFSSVTSLRASPIASSNLSLHPVYGRLYQIFKQIELEKFSHKYVSQWEKIRSSDLLRLYQSACFQLFYSALVDSQFVLKEMQREEQSAGIEGPSNITYELKGYNISERTRFSLSFIRSRSAPNHLRGAILFEITNQVSDTEKRTARTYLFPDLTWWGDGAEDLDRKRSSIHEIYSRLGSIRTDLIGPGPKAPKKKQNNRSRHENVIEIKDHVSYSVIMLHPTPTSEFDDRLTYEDSRMLMEQGDNFVTAENYDQFGTYKVGCLPIYPTYRENRSRILLRLKRIIRTQLMICGVKTICLNCFSPARMKSTGDTIIYECSNSSCHLRWGEVACKCGHKFMKAQFRNAERTSEVHFEEPRSSKEAIIASEWMEGQAAIVSVCESTDQLHKFWAICPNCGNCEKERAGSKSCWRCSSKQDRP